MTLLELVQTFCKRQGLDSPASVFSSQDAQVLQIAGLLDEVAEYLLQRRSWSVMTREATFTSVSGADQGAITSLADTGFQHIIADTFYDRTSGLPVTGPLSSQEWQSAKAAGLTGPLYQYRLRGGHLWVLPDMPASHSMAFEYLSQAYALASNGTTYKTHFTADTDTSVLPDTLMLEGLRWKWREEKGLPYTELFRAYEIAVMGYSGHDNVKSTLSMDGTSLSGPGIFVPAGNWNLTT